MKKNSSLSFLLLIRAVVFFLSTLPAANAAQPEYGMVVFPFKLEDVRLTPGSRLYNQMEANKSFLLSLNNDNILYNFRQTAGLPSPGSSYGGWEGSGMEIRGHFMGGHLLSALAKLYASTGDTDCKNKADYLVAELKKCQDAISTGYLSAYPTSLLDRLEANTSFTWAPYYTLHKILAGLIDCHKYCGNATALGMAHDLAAYIKGRMDNLTLSQIDAFLETRPFVWNFYHEHGGIAEALLDLYQITGDSDTLALANIFDRDYFTDPLTDNADELGYQEYHMNSHIPMVTAIARQYEVTNAADYRDAAVNFLNRMINGHSFPTGGASGTSPTHQGGNGEYYSYPKLFYEHVHGDTGESCCAHGLNEIAGKVFTWTGDPNYADDYENRFVNAVMSQQNPGNGMLLYYLSVGQGKRKSFDATGEFKCCAGSGVEAYSTLAEGAYFHDNSNGLYINQFIDSTLIWQNQGLTLIQTTDFPEEEGAQLRFNLSASKNLSVKIRIPSWATQGVVVKINGAVQNVNSAPNSYVTLSRTWNDGDVVELSLPFTLRTVKMPDRPDYVAVMYGPQLLAACTSGGAQFNGSQSELLNSFTPVSGQACTFTTTLSSGTVTYKPINRIITETYNGYTIIADPVATPVRDYVDIADSASETAHNLQSYNSSTGTANGKNYRDAANGGWFSYEMEVDPAEPMYVRCTYWGSDSSRVFYIQIDGTNIATEMLENNHPNVFFQLIYPVPVELTNGKTRVIVKFQAKPGNTAGGVFDRVEMLTYDTVPAPPVPISAYSQIEAEDYDTQSGTDTETCSEGGQNVGWIENGDYLVFERIDFGGGGAFSFDARVASDTSGGSIELHLDSVTGPQIGTCAVPDTGDWQTWVTQSCHISGATGIHDLYLKFTGGGGYLLNVNWWRFIRYGDMNADNIVNADDLSEFAGYWLQANTTLDLNADGIINLYEFTKFAQNWLDDSSQ